MPLHLEIQKKLTNRSDRVKAVDFHPTEPWLLSALYSGSVNIWNYVTQALVKTFPVSELPIRACKFLPRKNWLVAGSDDLHVRVFNYNTHEKVIAFEAHQDYIRSVAVHPSQPFLLTASDDMTIKMWDWEKGWKCVMTFEGHTHYVMHVVFNPKDGNSFASASLDRSVKVWSLGSSTANYTLEGHQKGVNCVDYYHGADKPYLISGADDKTVKIWDYQNKSCVQTLEGHTQNITVACFHPELPIIITGSEDGTIRIWHAQTYRLENTLNYGMERVWAIAYLRGVNDVAFGYDEGTISVRLGREEPAISMDNSGKIIYARHNEILTANVKASVEETVDGERIALQTKDLGSSEIFPQQLQHSPNGRFVVVCGDGEYIIYTALAWRNKSFGRALDFVWALDSNEYAIRESTSTVKLYKAFKEKDFVVRTNFIAEGIFGGCLLGVKSQAFLSFFDWETGRVVRRVDVDARQVFWSESEMVCVACDEAFYILRFHRQAFASHDVDTGDEGVEEAFEFVCEINEKVMTGCWVGDCFLYTNSVHRLNYLVGGQVSTLSHFDHAMYLLGYIPRDNRVYLCDKDMAVFGYTFPQQLIEYQTAVLRGDLDTAQSLLPAFSQEQKNRAARFLEKQGFKEEALEISTDPEHRFELALSMEKLDVAYVLAKQLDQTDKWRSVGEYALKHWNFPVAEECFRHAQDLDTLLLWYLATGNRKGMEDVAHLAAQKEQYNIGFLSLFLANKPEAATHLLKDTGRIPEAALFARTYCPHETGPLVQQWRKTNEHIDFLSTNETAAREDGVSDAMSHLSMEVNTTGTGSLREYDSDQEF